MKRKTPPTPDAMKLRLADLCARSEQCEYDLRQKLTKAKITGSDADAIITFLKDGKFVDNARFARSYAADKCRFSAWGKYKIRAALALKRISPPDISRALSSIPDEEWLNAARRAGRPKARALDLIGEGAREDRIKLYRFLTGRGFESALAVKVTKELAKAQKEEAEGC